MIDDDRPNPFAVLGLDIGATDAEVVAAAAVRDALATNEEERSSVRKAMEELITHPLVRAAHAVLAMPVPAPAAEDPVAALLRLGAEDDSPPPPPPPPSDIQVALVLFG